MQKTVCTHDGEGHMDDWFAVAIFLLANPDYTLCRTRDKQALVAAEALIDVGGIYDIATKRFDHHQRGGAGERPNGIPYASAGLVWKEYGLQLCDDDLQIVEKIDRDIISYIDSMDTRTDVYDMKIRGTKVYSIREYFYCMYRPFEADRGNLAEYDRLFIEAVKAITELLKMEIAKAKERKELMQLVKECYELAEDKRIIFVPKSSPFETVLPNFPEPIFVILPYQQTKFVIIAIKENGTSKDRLSFPIGWRAKSGRELEHVAGISNLEFCHGNGFMLTTHNLESAKAVAKKAIEIS